MELREDNLFLEGQLVYLRKPNIEKDIINGSWHQWFNDMEITEYLTHGVFPNDRSNQLKVVESHLNSVNSLLLSIVDKENKNMIGIISFKSIDFINRSAEIGIVMGFEKKTGAALEAMALLTQHGFDRLNLEKIYAGQHERLWSWVNSLETIGYKIEGIRRKSGFRNGTSFDTILTGITNDDYYEIIKNRGGKLISSIEELYKKRKKENQFVKYKKMLFNFF